MTHSGNRFAALLLGAAVLGGTAHAGDLGGAGDYNNPYGMNAGQENAPIDPSLRDANGNLSVVNGVFTSSNMGSGSMQQMSSMGAVGTGSSFNSGVGFGGGGVSASAQAIGNSLNVVTVGTGNTVIVNSHQTNNGDQNADVDVNGN
ncbi:MAG TPA: holdfast anchoring protein HfaA [Rhizomicrobium sp.]|jgi:holdfast attachment protein HfaA